MTISNLFRTSIFVRCLTILLAFGLANQQSSTQAQIFTWTGAVDSQFFSVPGNWSPTGIPTPPSEIRFDFASTAASGLRMFDGTNVASTLVLDGATTTLRPEGTFSTDFLRVGGTATATFSSSSLLSVVDFNGNSRIETLELDVGSYNFALPATRQSGNLQIGAGTELVNSQSARVGGTGNNGFLSVIGGGELSIGQFLTIGNSFTSDVSTLGFVTIQSGSFLQVGDDTTLGWLTSSDGANAEGVLEAAFDSNVSLQNVVLGRGNAIGRVIARDSIVTGGNFALGVQGFGGVGEGHLQAIDGGRIDAVSISSANNANTIRAENGGLISAEAIQMNGGTMLVVDGTVESNSDLNLISSQLDISGGLGSFRSISGNPGSSIHWTGGEIQLFDDFTLVGVDGLFNLQTVVPANGHLLLTDDILILSELQIDGALTAPRIYSFGDLILNDATLTGMTELSGSSTSFVDGVVSFNGNVTGRGQFVGADSTVRFLSRYAPGNDTEGAVSIGFDGSVELASSCILDLEIFGSGQGQYDQLDVEGDLQIAGQLEINCPNGFVPSAGDEFMIAQIDGTTTGEFDSLTEGSVAASMEGVDLLISYGGGDGNDVVLIADSNMVLLGDVNLDGEVNLLDIQPFIALVSSGSYQVEADTNEDGVVNLLDVDSFIELLAG